VDVRRRPPDGDRALGQALNVPIPTLTILNAPFWRDTSSHLSLENFAKASETSAERAVAAVVSASAPRGLTPPHGSL
jgi:hypothetical protein